MQPVFKKDKSGNLIRQKQVTSYKMDKKGNGYFESLTFHADGKIDRYREEFFKGEKTKILKSTMEKPDSLKSRFVPIFEKSQRENLTEKGSRNLKSSGEIFEKSRERKFENLKDAGLQKSEKSEFEKEIYQQGDLSKNEKFERQIEIER